jgi:hypothetical protein
MKNLMLSVAILFAAFLPINKEVPVVCEENIQPDCYCILIYDPVCGCNNKTYGNACQAMCAGITDFKKGECKDKIKDKKPK